MMRAPVATVALQADQDLVTARRRAREVAVALGVGTQGQTEVATVVSEIARNALRYAGGGSVQFALENDELIITVSDRGPGIANLDAILRGEYVSRSGMGLGIVGARRLMDDFTIRSDAASGTTIEMRKRLPRHVPEDVAEHLARKTTSTPLEELQQQNAELLQALTELKERHDELQRLDKELEDTNRGVLALYAELDEKAESLRRADNLKTRFLSDMGHEFRTPVNAILALTRLLQEGGLQGEAAKQLSLIGRAASDLEALVNDLLDMSKIEAGKIDIHVAEFDVTNLFSALRGMMRPLLTSTAITLTFDDAKLPTMVTDEGKVAQILRNFISNAIKFTEEGEVRVSAELSGDEEAVIFAVADSGIGIAPEDQGRIFDEYTQVDSPLQRRHKGTGLGLPLTRKLSHLLGGSVSLRSEPGKGSTFFAAIPLRYGGGGPAGNETAASAAVRRLLIIDDDETARYTLGNFASRPGVELLEAENGLQGLAAARNDRPDVILLDLMMPGMGGHEVLARLKSDPVTESIPVVIVTSRFVNEDERREILTRAKAVIYKGDLSREVVAHAIAVAVA